MKVIQKSKHLWKTTSEDAYNFKTKSRRASQAKLRKVSLSLSPCSKRVHPKFSRRGKGAKFREPIPLNMTKQEFLEAAASRYDELQALNKVTDFYDYEVEFVRIWRELGKEVLEKNIGELSRDKRKKKPHDTGLCND